MPKEIVRSAAEADESQPYRAEVSWGQDSGYVQVGTTREGSEDRLLEIIQGGLAATGRGRLSPETVEDVKRALQSQCGPNGFDGWHTTLTDRRDVNALIRHLRRARDGAFGRDE